MSEFLRNWLLGITCAAMVLTLAESIVPEGSGKRVCHLAGGLVLLIASLSPVIKLEMNDLIGISDRYEQASAEMEQSLQTENEFLYECIIEEQTAAYILDKAKELEVNCKVSVTVRQTDAGLVIPYAVSVEGTLTGEQEKCLSQFLTADLGIPLERQHFERTKS